MDNKVKESSKRFEEVIEYLEKGKLFTKELMDENERLRLRLLMLEKKKMDLEETFDPQKLTRITEENKAQRARIEALEARFAEVEKENKDFAQRYVEVQAQNDNLLNLYVSSYQLHSTLDPSEVVNVIQQIILNLIGAEEYSIYMLDKKKQHLVLIAGEGPEGPIHDHTIVEPDQVLESVIKNAHSYFRENGKTDNPHLACIPLKVKQDVVGAISITKLLSQKGEGFSTIDHELMELLGDHAATALVSAELYNRTERKLRTVESFIELLKLDQNRGLEQEQ